MTDNRYIVHHVLPFDVRLNGTSLGRHDALAAARATAQWASEFVKEDVSVEIFDLRTNAPCSITDPIPEQEEAAEDEAAVA
jgi:hypothetical protein